MLFFFFLLFVLVSLVLIVGDVDVPVDVVVDNIRTPLKMPGNPTMVSEHRTGAERDKK